MFKKATILFLVLITIIILRIYQARVILNDQYAILFDAGSTGTRMLTYKYNANYLNWFNSYTSQPSFEQIMFCDLNDGGLSSYKMDDSVGSKFQDCMLKANQIIPIHKRQNTFIGLAATAGMRLLQIKNKKLVDGIFENVRSYFRTTGYLFNDDRQVRIITGQEEGLFAWNTVNFLHNKFQPNVNKENTYGILELGGSSGQISFISKNFKNDSRIENNFKKIQLNNLNYEIYSNSFLCFGSVAFFKMYISSILKKQSYASSSLASCLPDGSYLEIAIKDMLDFSCVNGLMYDDSHNFTVSDPLTLKQKNESFNLFGSSKQNECKNEIEKIIPKPKCSHGSNDCTFNGVYLPSQKSTQFLALSNFYEAFNYSAGILNKVPKNDLAHFNETTNQICSMSYQNLLKLNKENNVGLSNNRLKTLCFENVYIMKLFELFGFRTLQNVDFVDSIKNTKVNWSLGYLIYEISRNKDLKSF